MILTCLECGHQRKQRDPAATMNQRCLLQCEGKCGRITSHIAGLPPEHRHISTVSRVSKRSDVEALGRFLTEPPPARPKPKPRRK